MELPSIFASTLGICHPWQVTAVSFAEDNRLDITVNFAPDGIMNCPLCGKDDNPSVIKAETWYHDNFFHYKTFLHARVPHIECARCGILSVERPWSRAGSKFALTQ